MFGARNSFLTAAGLPSDSLFEYVTLLLDGNGTNGGQNNTFLDSSTNNFAFTRNGNTTQGSFSPYGTLWSNYFDGSGDNLSIANNPALNFDTGTFTVEAWFNQSTLAFAGIVSKWPNVGGDNWLLVTNGDGSVRFYYNGGNILGGSYSVGTWNHIAVSRDSSNVIRLFLNGTQVASVTSSFNSTGTAPVEIGSYASNSNNFTGYISNVRVVKGTAVYTSNFTPSTTPLTAITNTSLLTCQSNRFVDNGFNNLTLTASGTPSAQRFSPFEPSAPYDTSVIGGSGYFDGTGDYLTGPTNSAFNLGTGDFTVECWVYRTATGTGYETMLGFDISGGLLFELYLGQLDFGIRGTANNVSGVTVPSFQWVHLALARQSGVVRYFQNGVLIYTYTGVYATQNFTNNTNALISGYAPGDGVFNGYINDLRLIKGTAIYTANFTPPTAPLTAIANTSLLLKFTNAAIPDYAMQNNLETAGNAQISTSVKKFGTGSLSFDGTGDYLRTPANNFALPLAGNFTIEFWVYFNSTSTTQTIIGQWESPTFWEFYYLANTQLRFYYDNTNFINLGALSTSTWYHVAAVRNGSTITAYLNGTSQGTASSSAAIGNATKALGIGSESPWTGFYFNGYLDDIRITNGVARYTSNFTPPTAALPIY